MIPRLLNFRMSRAAMLLAGAIALPPALAADKHEEPKAPAAAAKEAPKPAAKPAATQAGAGVDDDLRKSLAQRLAGGSGEVILKAGDDAPAARPAAPRPRKPRPVVVKHEPAEEKPHHGGRAAHAHWSYEGEFGPAAWGKMKPDYTLCETGLRQSPIDIRGGIKVDLPTIQFDYKPSMFNVVDNGHTIQVNYGEGSSISVQGRVYHLVQFHFHKPSEERINGKVFDMVAHLVHKDDDGHLAVVAVLLEKGDEHPVIQTVWNNLPLEQNTSVTPNDVSLDLSQLLPENRAYFTYMGSLTTPPCSEGVLWLVLKTPARISAEQVAIFNRLYKNNARPIQRASNRLIKESR